MSIERHHVNPRMSMASVYNGVVYLAGVNRPSIHPKASEGQTRQVLAQIEEVLATVGSEKRIRRSCCRPPFISRTSSTSTA